MRRSIVIGQEGSSDMRSPAPTFEEMTRHVPPPRWVIAMHEHYAKTGEFRPQDLERVLGDRTEGVRMDADEAVRVLMGRVAS